MKRLCVFCGSSTGTEAIYAQVARDVGHELPALGYGIVYGGGRIGLMGIVADAALAAGGEVLGVIPQSLADREVEHHGLTQLHIVASMHERKALMADFSDGFIALPGGFGTFEEFCEVLTWAQLKIHNKPVGLLNVNGYYDELLALFDKAVREGFVSKSNRALVLSASSLERLITLMGL
ncbi:MAG: TIGR00730 family Rossman fold protein [Candidatus Eremiobacteraeota bacterium]|nr:TIGR00730 family Rossman fold protein [Candidatus Eremiobacteraeota bacterium]